MKKTLGGILRGHSDARTKMQELYSDARTKMKMTIKSTFAVYKKPLNSGEFYGYEPGLTHEEARDTDKYPAGIQYEQDGTAYVWAYGANNGRKF